MTNEERKALEDLIEAVEAAINAGDWKVDGACDPTLVLIRAKESLAQPDQDEVDIRSRLYQRIHELETQLAQPEQEPVAWEQFYPDIGKPQLTHPPQGIYYTPPQRTWVGLTDEEIEAFDTWHDNREEEVGWCNPSEIVAYIEAKLKEKNT